MNEEFSPPCFWSCAKGAPLGHLSRAPGVPETFRIELSAHEWEGEARVFDDLARAFSFPGHFGRNWHAAGDRMSDVRDSRPKVLAVIRDIPESEAARIDVARVAATIGAGYPEDHAQCAVLDGWERAEIEVR
jgi:hypothetical protein